MPFVTIQAPVVLAALSKPFLKTRFSFGCRSKLRMPPCTVMSSFGKSRPQCCQQNKSNCNTKPALSSRDQVSYISKRKKKNLVSVKSSPLICLNFCHNVPYLYFLYTSIWYLLYALLYSWHITVLCNDSFLSENSNPTPHFHFLHYFKSR